MTQPVGPLPTPPGARLVDDPAELADFFSDNTPAHIYALADLEEPFWESSLWYRRDDAVVGVVSLPSGEGCAVYGVSTRDPNGSLALVADLAPFFPSGQLITAPLGLGHVLAPLRPVAWSGPHRRMHLRDVDTLPPKDPRVVALNRPAIAELERLYGSDPGAAFFLPHMVDDDTFVGVYDDDELVAAAGTHVLSSNKRCAAIGAVYTRPSHRGSGLGRAVTLGVLHRIRGRVDVVGLNVAATNERASSLYEALGFVAILDYEEAELR